MSTRTYSIWLAQLLLAGVIIITVLMAQALTPQSTTALSFTVGVSIIIIATAVTLAVPWDRLPDWAVLIVPLVDIGAIGLLTIDPALSISALWLFPVVWIATYFSYSAISIGLGLIAISLLVRDASSMGEPGPTMRIIVTLLSFGFISLFTHTTATQNAAFKQLLRRQADKLSETVERTSRQEREVSLLLDAVDVGVVRLSARGSIVFANQTYRELYGLSATDVSAPARSVEYDSYRGTPLSPACQPLSRAVAGERFFDERIWLFDQTGAWHVLSMSARDLDDEGVDVGTVLVAHDITDEIGAQTARETLAARVSHELRNPLTAVLGYSDLLMDDESSSQRTRDQASAINVAAERMMHMIGELLVTQADARQTPMVETTDLWKICSDCIESFAPAARAAGVLLRLDTAEQVLVEGDGFRLRQVLDNLVSNAIKYTLKGGRVRVAATIDDNVATVIVADTGVGMSQADVARVFEPYFRSDSARASAETGTGLGMGIVESIIKDHGGEISLQSAPGSGTKVTITMPGLPERDESAVSHSPYVLYQDESDE